MRTTTKKSLPTLTVLSTAWFGWAAAQSPPLDQTGVNRETDRHEIPAIIVTAQKRAENVQSVPLAVTAVDGESLAEQNVFQLQELKHVDPSVQFRVSTAPNTSAFLIRGIGTSSLSAGIEQSVSTVLDGVVLGDPATVATLTDINHVEILKGPQGMLFGKNASSGVISITTNDPKLRQFEAITHLSFGEHNEQILQGILNTPVSDTVALRFTVTHNELEGFVTDPFLDGAKINPTNITAGSAKLLWNPSDAFKLVFSADGSYTGNFCCVQVTRSAPDPHSPVAVASRLYGVNPAPDTFEVVLDAKPVGYGRVYGGSIRAEYEFNDWNVQSISGYRRAQRSNFYDADFIPVNVDNQAGIAADVENYSEELRVASPLGPKFDWVAGVFAFIQRNSTESGFKGYFPAGPNPPPAAQPALYIPDDTITIVGTPVLRTNGSRITVNSKDFAGYFQGRLHITDQLSVIAGGRLTRDDLKLHLTTGPYLDPSLPLRAGNGYIGYPGPYVTPCVTYPATPPAIANCFPAIDQSTGDTNFSYRATIQDQFTKDVMGYFTYARGYKGPGFSALSLTPSVFVNGVAPEQSVASEIPTSFELGVKTELLDHRLVLNADVFHTDYQGFQSQVSTATPNGFVAGIRNAGSVMTYGAEFNVIAEPFQNLTMSGGATYLHARYGDFDGVTCYTTYAPTATNINAVALQPDCTTLSATPGVGTLNVKGNRVAGAPDWQATLSGSYQRPHTIGAQSLFVSLTYDWQSEVQYSANGDPGTVQPAFGLLGGALGVGSDDDKWRLSIYGVNILDKHWAAAISATPTVALNPGGYVQYFSPDAFRHIGIKLDARF